MLFNFNYIKFIVFIIIIIVIFQIQDFQTKIIFKVFAVLSPPIVRQEIVDDEKNDWQPWQIENENENEINNKTCRNTSPISLPNIQSVSYRSDGEKLNVTIWLSHIFSDANYEDIIKNETIFDVSEISSDVTSIDSLSLSQPRLVQFVMAIDIISAINIGIDYTVELSSPNNRENPKWTQNIYEISAYGNKKLLYNETFNSFPYNDKNFVEFSIDLKTIGNPDKYKLLFYIVDAYDVGDEYVGDEYCRRVDTSNWSLIPPPEFTIIPSTSNIVMRPPEEKNILVNINTNSELESNATLKVNYTSEDNEERKKVNINFISNITITPFTNNSAILKIVTLDDKNLKDKPKQIPLKISATISFPQTITNRGGDIYYINKTTTIPKYSDLTLTLLPPLTFTQQLDNFTKSIQPISVLWGIFTTIGLGVSGFIAFLYKRIKDKKELISATDDERKKEKKDNNSFEGKRSPI